MKELSLTEFADSLLNIIPVMMKEFLRHQAKDIPKMQVTIPQIFVMEHINRQPRPKMKDLAEFMNVSMATMTGIVDRLVRNGYLERLYDKADRRIINVALTKKGGSLLNRICSARREMIMHIFSKVSQRDRQSYLRILTQIKNILQEGNGLKESPK